MFDARNMPILWRAARRPRVVEQDFGITDMNKNRRQAPPIGIDGRSQRMPGIGIAEIEPRHFS